MGTGGCRITAHSSLPPLARDREQEGVGRSSEGQTQRERDVNGTVSFLHSEITVPENVLGSSQVLLPWKETTGNFNWWLDRGCFQDQIAALLLLSGVCRTDSHKRAENELSGECVMFVFAVPIAV